MTLTVAVNSRFRLQRITGVQRFAAEVTRGLHHDDVLSLVEYGHSRCSEGIRGHLWEQLLLPHRVGTRVLFSPANTGPLAVSKQFVVIHDASVWDQPHCFTRSFRQFYQGLLPQLAKRCAKVGTVSRFSKERLLHYLKVPEEKITVLSNAVDSQFVPLEFPSAKSKERYLLCVASLEPRKNFARLIEAWSIGKQRGEIPDDVSLKLVGGANPRNFPTMSCMSNSSTIKWLGRVTDEKLVELYQNAEGFIFPSLYEGFGLPPLEAMACGCPVALSRSSSLPEVGGDAFLGANSSGAAIYFDPRDVENIASSLAGLLTLSEQERDQIRVNGIKRAATFSWENIARQVSKELCQID